MEKGVFSAAAARYPWSDDLREHYDEKHYILLRDLVTPQQVGHLLEVQSQCAGKVYSGNDPSSVWKTHHLPDQHWLKKDAAESSLIDRFNVITGNAIRSKNLKIWYMDYREGEFVEKHSDHHWTLVLVICLRGVAKANGGTLHLCTDEQEYQIHLKEGMAVAFSGTTPHYTTPLVPSLSNPEPIRTCLAVSFL